MAQGPSPGKAGRHSRPGGFRKSSQKERTKETMKIQIQKIQGREHIVPAGKFYDGDWFKCQNCGNTIRMKVLGNYATCSECGGRMVRI